MAASPVKTCPVCKATYGAGEVFCPVDGGRLGSPSQMPRANEPKDPLVGVTLGERYLVRKRVGEGGMGIVYAGQHVVIDKRVAIKVLREDFSRRQDVVERFRQEAKSASRIANPHIVDISDFGETPHGDSYFVMEFLEGEDLSRVLARESTLKPERAIRIALQCCDALGAAHEAGIVHRDMKPENVFLVKRSSEEDFVKIVDFGIAKMNDIETDGAPGRKLTKTGMIFG
ncbi:MAG: serine/threonine protein kinase, partial [Myxococcales bacterium]|nr:serine/threonine protein kinase [Myxococcales bacterium]